MSADGSYYERKQNCNVRSDMNSGSGGEKRKEEAEYRATLREDDIK